MKFKKIYKQEIFFIKRSIYSQYVYLVTGHVPTIDYTPGHVPGYDNISDYMSDILMASKLPTKIYPVLWEWFNRFVRVYDRAY